MKLKNANTFPFPQSAGKPVTKKTNINPATKQMESTLNEYRDKKTKNKKKTWPTPATSSSNVDATMVKITMCVSDALSIMHVV